LRVWRFNVTEEAQPRPIELDDATVTPVNGETKLSELASSSAAETDAYAAPVTTTSGATWTHAGVVVAAAAGIVLAAVSVSPAAIADDDFHRFTVNCGQLQTATPQLCNDTWAEVPSAT